MIYTVDKVYRNEDHIGQVTELWRFVGGDDRTIHLMVYAYKTDREYVALAFDDDCFERRSNTFDAYRWRAIRKQVKQWEKGIVEHYGYTD